MVGYLELNQPQTMEQREHYSPCAEPVDTQETNRSTKAHYLLYSRGFRTITGKTGYDLQVEGLDFGNV